MLRLRGRSSSHPGIRQFILRTGVLNYLGKSLQLQWDDWHNQRMQLFTLHESLDSSPELIEAAEESLTRTMDQLTNKVISTRRLLQREYNELNAYMVRKRDLWDCPEYFKAKTALGLAHRYLKKYK